VGRTCGAAARLGPWRCSCATAASRGTERATNDPVDVPLGPTDVRRCHPGWQRVSDNRGKDDHS
jgi:hypothetical protein